MMFSKLFSTAVLFAMIVIFLNGGDDISIFLLGILSLIGMFLVAKVDGRGGVS